MDAKKKAVAKPSTQKVMIAAARKILAGSYQSLCGWVQWNADSNTPESHTGEICYAAFINYDGGIKEARVIIRPFDIKRAKLDAAMPYWNWLVNKSFWSKSFKNKDVRNGIKNGFRMDMEQPFMLVHGAAIGIRMAWEYPNSIVTWKMLVDKGVDPHVAHVAAHNLRHVDGNDFCLGPLNSHSLLSGSITDPIRYREQRPHLVAELKTKAINTAGSYKGNSTLFYEKGTFTDSAFYDWLQTLPLVARGVGKYVVIDDAVIERIKKEEWNVK